MNKLLFVLPMAVLSFSASVHAQDVSNDHGLNLSNLDTKTAPGQDFYRFATGGWTDANPIPDEFSRYGSFDKLRENNQRQVRELIEELGRMPGESGQPSLKIGDLYRVGMDSIKLNAEGAAPVKAELTRIQVLNDRQDLPALVAAFRKMGVSTFFDQMVSADDKNSSMNILHLWQGGLQMGDRDYYLLKDKDSETLRQGYLKLMETQFMNAGYSQKEAVRMAKGSMTIETALAEAHFPKEKLRMPELNYHKMNVSDLDKNVAAFPWKLYLEKSGISHLESLNVGQVEAISAAVKLMQQARLDDLKAYLSWCLIHEAAPYLSDAFVNANFDFYGKQLSGAKVLRPRWKRVVSTIDEALGEEVGKLYVAKYFPPQAKERMLKLVDNLKLSLSERINQLEWMSSATKAKAQEKLSAFIVKIGYPDKWRDYTSLAIQQDSYWANIQRSNRFEYDDQLSKLGQPVDKMEWLMTPQTVNAYYNPATNEICFPAGILQPPFFYMNADDAVNYGAIGVVIGHEMTHGFDDQGCKYDKEGNVADWWTPEDAARFQERTKVLVDYFNQIIVLNDVHANGEFTQGENIADHGGLQISYNGFLKTEQSKTSEKIDGYTPQQRFFLSYANLWAQNIRDAEILRLTKMDPHSLGKWRVNAALPHIAAWYEAFGVTPESPLYLPLEKRASVW